MLQGATSIAPRRNVNCSKAQCQLLQGATSIAPRRNVDCSKVQSPPFGGFRGLSLGKLGCFFLPLSNTDAHISDVRNDFTTHDMVESERTLLVFLEVELGQCYFTLVQCNALT